MVTSYRVKETGFTFCPRAQKFKLGFFSGMRMGGLISPWPFSPIVGYIWLVCRLNSLLI